MTGTVAVIDYGLGNLKSVAAALAFAGGEVTVTSDAAALRNADRLVLPGVGAFGDGMRNLRNRGLVDLLDPMVRDGKPILGICLGAQLLCTSSEEFGHHQGLGWVDGEVHRIAAGEGIRVPHVGWNEMQITGESPLFKGLPDGSLLYYCHSYAIQMTDSKSCIGTCNYGGPFVAAFQKANVYGIQPHPEKSQRAGLDILKNFVAI